MLNTGGVPPVRIVKYLLSSGMDLEALQIIICNRMKEIRIQKGMTQEDFEIEDNGISSRHIRSIETHEYKNIKLETLLKFCYHAKIHPKELFEFEVPWK